MPAATQTAERTLSSAPCWGHTGEQTWQLAVLLSNRQRSDERGRVTGTRQVTYSDGVDGVGVTIVVAIVIVLPSIAAGHDKNASKAPATSNHPMLQGSLGKRKDMLLLKSELLLFPYPGLPAQLQPETIKYPALHPALLKRGAFIQHFHQQMLGQFQTWHKRMNLH